MLNYIKLLMFALLASFCLQFKFQNISLAQRLTTPIKRSSLGRQINTIARIGIHRIRKVKQKHYNTTKKQLSKANKLFKARKQAEKILDQ